MTIQPFIVDESDREAAVEVFLSLHPDMEPGGDLYVEYTRIQIGMDDGHELVEAFARHRAIATNEIAMLRKALLDIAPMIPGVVATEDVSSEFLARLPEELSHYRLSRDAVGVQPPVPDRAVAPEEIEQAFREGFEAGSECQRSGYGFSFTPSHIAIADENSAWENSDAFKHSLCQRTDTTPLLEDFNDLFNTFGPRGYGRDTKEQQELGEALTRFWAKIVAAALLSPREKGWQDIYTAPFDRMVLVYCERFETVCEARQYREGGWKTFGANGPMACHPRAWMEKPARPSEDQLHHD